jgi:hypothetical protein
MGALCLFALASVASGQFGNKPKIEPLDSKSRKELEAQRELVARLGRRYVGSRLSGTSLDDLRIVQRLFDRHPPRDQALVLSHNDITPEKSRLYEMQALGVVVGDVMAHNFDLEWVVFEDQYGRSRALNVKGTTDLVFPVTMISKRYEVSLPVNVRALYDEIAATLSLRPEKSRRRRLPASPEQ